MPHVLPQLLLVLGFIIVLSTVSAASTPRVQGSQPPAAPASQPQLKVFLDFASELRLGDFDPTQCELTYINHLFAGQQWKTLGDLSELVSVWSGRTTDAYLPDPEDVRLAWQYRFEESAKPLGRLHVKVQSAFRTSDRLPVILLQLLGRGAPLGGGVDGVLAFADRAHEWIVRGFTSLTTDRMHAVWERQR